MVEDVHSISTGRVAAADVARHSFGTLRRGFDPHEVRAYLELVARELMAREQREQDLRHDLEAAEERAKNPVIDESTLSAALGQQSASILRNAHGEAARIARQAEEEATALVREAQAHAAELRVEAESNIAERIAEAEISVAAVHQQAQEEVARLLESSRAEGERLVEKAREQGKAMIEEAQETRRRILTDMAQRRRAMTLQIEQFRAARDELAASVLGLRGSVDRVLVELEQADDRARTAAAEVARREEVVPPESKAPPTPPAVGLGEVEGRGSTTETSLEAGPSLLDHGQGEASAPSGEPGARDVVDEVEGLFARLRASQSADEATQTADLEGSAIATDSVPGAEDNASETVGAGVAGSPDPAGESELSRPSVGMADDVAEDAIRTRRALLLDPVIAQLARRTKRALQDDQNRLLDRLRSSSGAWTEELLPEEAEERLAYAEAVSDLLHDAFQAGATFSGELSMGIGNGSSVSDDAIVTEVVDRLSGSITALLRRRLTEVAADGDGGDAADRVGAAFREWRGERIERMVGDFALEAFSSGALAAVGPDAELRWVVGGTESPCADCDDNSLAGAVGAGEEFPTGHRHPPAHPGCRCLVVPTSA